MEQKQNKLLYGVTYVFDWIYRILLEYSKLVLVIIVVIVTAQVFSRRVLGSSIRWSEEVALLLMVWMAFIAMAIGVEKRSHIAITMFFDRFPQPVQVFFTKLNLSIVLAIGVVLLWYGSRLIWFTRTSTLPATQWPACVLYLMIPVSGFFISYFSFMDLFGLDRYRHTEIEDGGDGDNV